MTLTEEKKDAAEIIEALKKLPLEKQEYINGYIQGVADMVAAEQKESA
ncbi:MAG: hypothetical protein UIH27_11870 [Ruminococcus sp.]|nr:hypothetical protein [Ruminococcus sp.]